MKPGSKQTYQFANFFLDVTNGELWRDGERIQVPPKVLETLIVLVERGGTVVSKNEMMSALWPDTYVEEANLTQNIFTLRKILSETNGTKFIETVPRRGYKFAADVRSAPGEFAELVLQHDTRTRVVVEPARSRISPSVVLIAVGAVVLITGVLIAGAVFLWARLNPIARQPLAVSPSSTQPTLKRLTYQASVYHGSISPDGKYLAYDLMIDTENGPKQSLQLQNISTGSVVQVMPPAMPGHGSITFSPDGNYLYFGTGRKEVKNGIIARVPVFGGTPQEIVTNSWSAFGLSPDGRQVVFVRGYPTTEAPQGLIVANTDDGKERELVVNRWLGQKGFNGWESAPAWSPDGQTIAVTGAVKDDRGVRGALFEVNVADGALKEIPTPRWVAIYHVAWFGKDKGLVVSARDDEGNSSQLWLIRYPSGEATKLTNDLSDYGRITVTGGSNLIVAQQTTRTSHIWLLTAASDVGQLTSGAVNDGHHGLDFSADGRVVFASNRNGTYDLWTMSGDGNDVRQLTTKTPGRNTTPVHTPDGRFLVFASNRTGGSLIWRTDTDGNYPVQLTRSVASEPAVSPDSRWVYYTNWTYSPTVIEKVSIDGGEPVRVTNGKYAASYPRVSPDGRLLAHTYYDEENGWHVAVIPAEGGDPIKLFDHAANSIVRWTPDSQALVFIKPVAGNHPGSNLWKQPIGGSPPTQLTQFGPKEDPITNFAISSDGKQIIVARGRLYSDVVLLSNLP